jgi:hypothetical protein
VYPADDGGCGYYRLIWPAEALADHPDVEVVVHRATSPTARLMLQMQDTPEGPKVVGLGEAPDADVVVLQRPLARELVDAIPHLQAAGVAVVVELDDDFQAIHRANHAWMATQPRHSPDRNWRHLQRACGLADLVTCTTTALARKYARHGRVAVLPNYLPALWANTAPAPQSQDAPQRLGWTGSIATHPTDLQVAATAVRHIVQLPQWSLAVIGTGTGVPEAFGLPADTPVDATGWVELYEYPAQVATLHLGVVPLDDTPFNEAKSWLKGLEMAAAGVPFVATATGPYRQLASLGVGRTAARPRDWNRELMRLARDAGLREDVAGRARQYVLAEMTLAQQAERWVAAWAQARSRRCGAVRT